MTDSEKPGFVAVVGDEVWPGIVNLIGEAILIRSSYDKWDKAGVVLCYEEKLPALMKVLIKSKASVPVFALVDTYDADALDKMFGYGYLHFRGVLRNVVGAPEVAAVKRVLAEDKSRRAQAATVAGDMSAGRIVTVGSKVVLKPGKGGERPLLSLFLDPTMQDFMQNLVHTVDSLRVEFPDFKAGLPELRAVLLRIAGCLLDEKNKGNENPAALELEAKKLLSREGMTAAEKARFHPPRPLLLEGDTGVGKTVVAQWINSHVRAWVDPNAKKEAAPFQRVSMVNIGREILESELFGTVQGAWSGAGSRPGKTLLARGGVLFLDEIGDLPLELQAKLLVYLDELEVAPDGWPYSWKIFAPAYIIAATNKDLKKEVDAGRFREDLYHRFPLRLRVPSLKERRGDIEVLVDAILQDPSLNKDRGITAVTREALGMLGKYDFPGNFRELESILAAAVFSARSRGRDTIVVGDLGKLDVQAGKRQKK